MTEASLRAAIAPASVAVVGASDNPDKIGGRPILYMRRHGYRGRIYPVNPSRAEVQGLTAYPSLSALPEVPELAMVIVGGEQAVAAVDECARLGVKVAIVLASGFAETGAEGRAAQDAMAARARAAGMRLVGPNSQGLANFENGAIASFSTLFTEMPPADGPVAVVSSSGGMCAVVYGLLRERGIGVRHAHATGNEADVTVSELALAVAADPALKLILLYLESIPDPHNLARLGALARARRLPVVMVKAGRSESGQRAAVSHTGALANEDAVVDAFCEQHGIWRVRDPHGLARAAAGYLEDWRIDGRRLVIISNSGASCVMGADAAADLGLPLAVLTPETRAALAQRLPGFATTTNPVDITAALLSNSRLFSDVLPVVADDPSADMVFINIPVAGAGYDVTAFAADTAAFAARTGKPVAVAAWQSGVAAAFRAAGVAVFANETEALGVLDQVSAHRQRMGREPAVWPGLPAFDLPHAADSSSLLNEAESLDLLAGWGLPVVPFRLCRSALEVTEAVARLGLPVAVKACSRDVPHKSEHGLVALDVASAEEAVSCFDAQWQRLADMKASREGVIVARMAKGLHEFLLGARLDPVFGPVVVVGEGGRNVETLPDAALLLPPFDEARVIAALSRLRMAPLLDGMRGSPPLDTQALAAAAVSLGRLMVASRGAIASVDLNPVRAGARGEGVVVVDALLERAAKRAR